MATTYTSSQRRPEGKFGGSTLHKFAKERKWTLLLASANIDLLYILDEHSRTPLHYLIELGCEDDNVILELIRLAPYQVRVADTANETPVHLACDYGVGLIVAYALLEADVSQGRGRPSVLTMENSSGKTPLDLIRKHNIQSGNNDNELTTTPSTTANTLFKEFMTAVQRIGKMPWKYHAEEYTSVLEVLEETARGNTGVAGMAY